MRKTYCVPGFEGEPTTPGAFCDLRRASYVESCRRARNFSRRQFYRDRRNICMRVARVLANRGDDIRAQWREYDALSFALKRATSLADQGFAIKAAAECRLILAQVFSKSEKTLVLLELANAMLELDEIGRAKEYLRDAKQLLREEVQRGQGRVSEALDKMCARACLLEFRIARQSNDGHEASTIMKNLSSDAGVAMADELGVATQTEIALFQAASGRFVEARVRIGRASALGDKVGSLAPWLRAQLDFALAYVLEDASVSSGERLSRYQDALNSSVIASSARGVLQATVGLANHWASMGDHEKTKAYADHALRIVQMMEGTPRIVAVGLDVGNALLRTKYWRKVSNVDTAKASRAEPRFSRNLKSLEGWFLNRSGRYEDAITTLTIAKDLGTTMKGRCPATNRGAGTCAVQCGTVQ